MQHNRAVSDKFATCYGEATGETGVVDFDRIRALIDLRHWSPTRQRK